MFSRRVRTYCTLTQSCSDFGEEQAPEDLPQYTKDELLDMDKDILKGDIAVLEEKIQNVNVELGVLAEYRRRAEEHTARSSDLHTAVSSRDTAKKRYDELRKLRLEGFMQGFSLISLRLKEMYQMITMGGMQSWSLSTLWIRFLKASYSASCRRRNHGKTSQTCLAGRKR